MTFFVIKLLVENFLFEYSSAIAITIVLFPSVLWRAYTNIVCANYFQVYKLSYEYTKNSIIGFLISLICIVFAYYTFKSVFAIAVASSVGLFFWSFCTDIYFYKKIHIRFLKGHIFTISQVALFIFVGLKFENIGVVVGFVGWIFIVILFYKKEIQMFWKQKFNFLNPKVKGEIC
jgi:hypothetical protein